MAIVDELIAVLGYDIQNEGELRQFNRSLDQVEKKAFAVGQALGKMGAIAGAAVAAGFSFLGASVIKTAAQFETYRATLETIEGSAAGAQRALDWVTNFAKSTPYEVDELTRAFVKLRSYGLDPMDGSMNVLGDTAAGMGKRIDQVVEAFADASTFQFERLRELGIVASQAGDQVTFAWTENGKSMSKTISKTSAEVSKFLVETWGKKFGGAMIRQSKTWTGMLSNLGDSWTAFQLKIGEAGFFDTVKAKLADLMDTVARWNEDGTIDRIATALSGAFTTTANLLGTAVERIGRHVGFLMENFEAIEPWLQTFGVGLLLLAAYAFPVLTAVAALALAVDDFLTYLEGGESIIGSFIEAFKGIPAALAEVDFNQLGRDIVASVIEGIRSAFAGEGSEWFTLKFDPAKAAAFMQMIKDAFMAQVNLFLGVGQAIADAIYNGLVAAAGKIKGFIQSLLPTSWTMGVATPSDTRAAAAAGANAGGTGGFQNMLGNMDKMNGSQAAPVAVDNSTKTNSVTTNVQAPVTVNVQEATQAPAAVGNAVSGAVNKGAQPSRMQSGPAL